MKHALHHVLFLVAAVALVAPASAQTTAQPFDMMGEGSSQPAASQTFPDQASPSQASPVQASPVQTSPVQAPALSPFPGQSQGYVAPMALDGAAPQQAAPQPAPAPVQAPRPAATTPTPAPAATPRFAVPSMVPSQGDTAVFSGPPVPAVPVTVPTTAPVQPAPQQPQQAGAPAVQPAPRPKSGIVRYIIPRSELRLEGENDQRAWSIFVTADEAGRDAELQVSYKNAIVVMPEASRIRMTLNGEVVLETQLASSDRFKTANAKLPSGLLRAGPNLLRIQAFQRHRTDCSPQSTYELWTDIDPASTFLTFAANGQPDILTALSDLPAVGYGPNGVTGIHIVAPSAPQASAAEASLKLVQALTLLGGYPNPVVTVSDRPGSADARGTLTVVLGPAQDVNPLLSAPIGAADTTPIVTFLNEPRLGASVLAVTGSNWGQVAAAADAIAASADHPLGSPRTVFNTAAWLSPDVHLFTGSDSVSFADLGVATQQFSGRRFRTQFAVGIPSDFYAQSYGEATVLLDAAYTSAVQPASHIDIYVNGQIAATTRIANRNGGIYRHLPVKIPFRHFRPGVNNVMIEAVINTEADQVCPPGGSIAGADRFVLFDSSEFAMPDFARIGRRPDLSALAGSAFPYSQSRNASPLVLGRYDLDTISATATLVGRLAIQAGRIVPLALTPAANVGQQSAIFVGAASEFADALLGELGIASSVSVNWKSELSRPNDFDAPPQMTVALPNGAAGTGGTATPGVEEPETTDAVFDRWRTSLAGGGGWSGQVSSFEDWMKRHFDISFASLRIGPAPDVAFEPKARSTFLLAQAIGPGDNSTWTMMTAPTSGDLASAAASVTAVEEWQNVGGQFSWYSPQTATIENQPVANYQFVRTQPLSVHNLRLIAANWFSSNIIFYAFCLIGLCVILGIITSGLLFRLGRPS